LRCVDGNFAITGEWEFSKECWMFMRVTSFGLGLWNRDLTEYTLGSFECPQRCIGFVLYISVTDLLSNICEKSKELIRNHILGNKFE